MGGLVDTLLGAEPARPLFRTPDGPIGAGDVRRWAGQAVARLKDSDDPIFLHTSSAARFVAGLLAASATGRRLVLPANAQPGYLAEVGCPEGALLDDAWFDVAPTAQADLTPKTDDPLLIFFTSGSTGAPKTVPKSLSRLEIEGRALHALWGEGGGDVVATVSHQHIYGLLFRIAWPLQAGLVADDCAAAHWEDLEGRLASAILVASPAHLTRLPPRADLFAQPPRLVFSSGQALPAAAAAASARMFGAAPIEVLGSTETGGIAWRRQDEPDTPWTPFASVQVGETEEGLLAVRSPYLQTDEAHLTGDGVERLPDGRFRLKPRQDRVVKVDGKRVSLPRVEEALRRLDEIDDAAVLTLPSRKDSLATVVRLTDAGAARLAELGAFRLSRALRQAAARELEPAERPKHWRFVPDIPVNSQGKRILSDLRALFDRRDPLDALNLEVRAQSETSATVVFSLPPDLVFFEGHFDGAPVMPGVAQTHLAMLIARRFWGGWPKDPSLSRLKFRRVLRPHDEVELTLRRDLAHGGIGFSYRCGGREVSHGEMGGIGS